MADPLDPLTPRPNRHPALTWLGAVTAGLGALPVWSELARHPGRIAEPRHIAWLLLFALFLAAFFAATLPKRSLKPLRALTLLAVQSLSAVSLAFLLHNTLTSVLLVIVASQFPGLLSLGPSLVWIAVQTAGFAAGERDNLSLVDNLMVSAVFAGFQLFAYYTFRIAESERLARADLAQTHESLLATRQLLAETTRTAERLRIARELHDVLGHHLTALSLHLEAALHLPDLAGGPARERVATAQQLAKGLLREVRGVVSTLRQEGTEEENGTDLRLAAALATLSAGAEEPRVHLTVPPDLHPDDSDRAHAVLRCAQEIYTNTVRHAGAHNLWLELANGAGGITLSARDDGRGALEIVPGHGLRGMRERIEKLGGRLDLSSAPGAGFAVMVWIPERP